LRVYGGFEHTEIGALLGVHEKTVRRDWLRAKALLAEWMQEGGR
jgi:DNA-directed RNA polymerase specialized sigma24 family protein